MLAMLIPGLIGPDQVGFVQDSQKLGSTSRFLNLIRYAEVRQTSSLLVLDADKAFNRVHWAYLDAILGKFELKGWVQVIVVLYSSLYSRVYSSGA